MRGFFDSQTAEKAHFHDFRLALVDRPPVDGLQLRDEEAEDARAEKAGEAELIIAKQRNGPVGEVALTFLKEFTRFEDRARNVSEPM